MKLIFFSLSDVQDIHDVLEVTVYDEDKDHKYEFLGKVHPCVFLWIPYSSILQLRSWFPCFGSRMVRGSGSG